MKVRIFANREERYSYRTSRGPGDTDIVLGDKTLGHRWDEVWLSPMAYRKLNEATVLMMFWNDLLTRLEDTVNIETLPGGMR